MIMPASTEFVSLCRSQVMVLTQALGASLTVVYLTDNLTDAANAGLIPIVAYPETLLSWPPESILPILPRIEQDNAPRLLPAIGSLARQTALPIQQNPTPTASSKSDNDLEENSPEASQQVSAQWAIRNVPPDQQLVLPLMHEGMVLGVLVTGRADRPWQEPERGQIERIAQTLTLACVLDQRGQWWHHDLQQQRALQATQQDLFHTLLHQFRNPLTALRTFGKLLLRRFVSDDPNREMVEGMLRESERLQDLLQQFDAAVALGDQPHWLPSAPEEEAPITWDTQAQAETTESDLAQAEQNPPASAPILLPGAGFRLEPVPYPLVEVITPLVQSATAIAQDRQLHFHQDLDPDLPAVAIDVRALREVISNLLDNALKYTPASGHLLVRLLELEQASGDGMEGAADNGSGDEFPTEVPSPGQAILIADTGFGIPPQDQEHLFERGYRGVQAASDIPGTGLGLAIAHDLIQRMGGTIQVFSPAVNSDLLGEFAPLWHDQPHPGTAVVVKFLPPKA
jgi:hypothetical protein